MNIVELKKLFNGKRINYWLFGGYALDLAVGRITREHSNIDLLIKKEDVGKAISTLEDEGFIIEYNANSVKARRGEEIIRLIIISEGEKNYVIPVLNYKVIIPKEFFNKKAKLLGEEFRRLPNELLYLLMKHSPHESDSIIASNLRLSKDKLKRIKLIKTP